MAHFDGIHNDLTQPLHHHSEPKYVTAHNKSSSSLRKKSDLALVSKVQCRILRNALANLQEIFFGTKLFLLFPAIPLAIFADAYRFGSGWVFALSFLGLIPLAERVSFLTEQIAFFTGPTVGGLLNATCGNATELIISLLALRSGKVQVVKSSLVGSIISNLLLVLCSSLLFGGLSNLPTLKEQTFDVRQADVGMSLLLLAVLSHVLPLLFRYPGVAVALATPPILPLSRTCSVIMLVSYSAYIFFQLKTHRQIFESLEESDDGDVAVDEQPLIGLVSGVLWLMTMTVVIALLSEYLVETIEEASVSWGLSVSFIAIILLPIVGNAAEHAGALIFACKNKLDIALGVSLGSAAQISVFVVPLCVTVAWIMDVPLDLDLNVLETASLTVAVLLTFVSLHNGTSHYLKGLVLLLAYFVIGACFFLKRTP